MAELNIGDHCAKPDCKQLDFLPIRCDECKLVFCKLHSPVTAHECQAPPRNVANLESNTETRRSGQQCQFPSCDNHELVPLMCESCEKVFCVRHKQKETHQCPKLWTATDEANAEREAGLLNAEKLDRTALHSVSRPLHPTGQSSEVKSTSKPISSRSRATAARLVLMQAKMHAKPAGNGAASLADEDRLVIRLCASAGLNPTSTETMPFFVGKAWPLGRVLDFAQEYFSVKTPKTGARLALCEVLEHAVDTSGAKGEKDIDLSRTVGDCVLDGTLQEACLLKLTTMD
ncbi:AN1-type zinc finger protein 1 [Fasciolopsis buskii]|uniref:AN1-type zinc finger protein 1 n=1 Tax=Fasciolopsis buskii TaxID=27845 RepID=A0A8E0RLT4_9TREM|nr:AN1-type zinc finger protein 1 [Fasciolopsis buski]